MKPENPFRDWLQADVYGGTWVPVAGLGGWVAPASIPALFPRGSKEALLESADWPFQFRDAGPAVWEYSDGRIEAHLQPKLKRGEIPLTPLAVLFKPPGRRMWLEPVQSFVLFHGAAPRRAQDGSITWEVPDEDGRPDEIARWVIVDDDVGRLEIRRHKLFAFLRDFEFDLTVFFEENKATEEVEDGWRDEEQEELRTWKVWATDVLREVRVVLRCVTVIEGPERSIDSGEELSERTLEYPIGTNPQTGEPVLDSYPGEPNERTTSPGAGNDNFLTPIFFKRQVLDHYLSDPRFYDVTQTSVWAGDRWMLPIAMTERGNVQAWLGDLGRISDSAQRHWQMYAIADDDEVPGWRIGQDIEGGFFDPPVDEGVERVRAGVVRCNEAAVAYCGVPLFAEVTGLNEERVKALHRPMNDSAPDFQAQVTTLAILLADHLNADFFKAVGAEGDSGALNRLATWLGSATGMEEADAREVIGGLYAVLAVRSKAGGAHRASSSASEVLEKAGIDADNLSAGFEVLANLAANSLEGLAGKLEDLDPIVGA